MHKKLNFTAIQKSSCGFTARAFCNIENCLSLQKGRKRSEDRIKYPCRDIFSFDLFHLSAGREEG